MQQLINALVHTYIPADGTWYFEWYLVLRYVRKRAQRNTAQHGTARHRTTLRCAADLAKLRLARNALLLILLLI